MKVKILNIPNYDVVRLQLLHRKSKWQTNWANINASKTSKLEYVLPKSQDCLLRPFWCPNKNPRSRLNSATLSLENVSNHEADFAICLKRAQFFYRPPYHARVACVRITSLFSSHSPYLEFCKILWKANFHLSNSNTIWLMGFWDSQSRLGIYLDFSSPVPIIWREIDFLKDGWPKKG